MIYVSIYLKFWDWFVDVYLWNPGFKSLLEQVKFFCPFSLKIQHIKVNIGTTLHPEFRTNLFFVFWLNWCRNEWFWKRTTCQIIINFISVFGLNVPQVQICRNNWRLQMCHYSSSSFVSSEFVKFSIIILFCISIPLTSTAINVFQTLQVNHFQSLFWFTIIPKTLKGNRTRQ